MGMMRDRDLQRVLMSSSHNDRAKAIDMRNRKDGIEKKEERVWESNSDDQKLGWASPTTALDSRGKLNRDPYC